MAENTTVLIVGAGVSGASSAAFLRLHGVPCVLVEKHKAAHGHPKYRGATVRSMELFRQLGVQDEVERLGEGNDVLEGIAMVESLNGRVLSVDVPPNEEEIGDFSPCPRGWCDQDQLEQLLLDRARELGAVIHFNTELDSVEQGADGVAAVVRDRESGATQRVRASYLMACDGAKSPIRERLGIGRQGPNLLFDRIELLFTGDLSSARGDRNFILYYIKEINGGFGALFPRRHAGSHLWQLSIPWYPKRGERIEDYSPERLYDFVRNATGMGEVPSYELHFVLPWQMGGLSADRYRDGRIFLVGDAAHIMPPTGGLGGNTCIQDAQNLAWKIAAVEQGTAGAALLDSYEMERKQVAELSMNTSLARIPHPKGREALRELIKLGRAEGIRAVVRMAKTARTLPTDRRDLAAVGLGYRYNQSTAVINEPSSQNGHSVDSPTEDPRQPSGQPGTRAPHVPLMRDGESCSTLDLFGRNFVLLAGSEAETWTTAASEVQAKLQIPLDAFRIGVDYDDVEQHWDRYGITSRGATLVRPDGFIAWRSKAASTAPAVDLESALARVSGLR